MFRYGAWHLLQIMRPGDTGLKQEGLVVCFFDEVYRLGNDAIGNLGRAQRELILERGPRGPLLFCLICGKGHYVESVLEFRLGQI